MTLPEFIDRISVNLSRPVMQELEILLADSQKIMPLLDRIAGVMNGHPLSREREPFEEVCAILQSRYRLRELVAFLRQEVERHGGLLSHQEAQIAYAMTKECTTVH